MTRVKCCDVKPGETREFTVKIRLNCSAEEDGSCVVSANCCDDQNQDCCRDDSE